jgi:hypothetical protein
VIDKSWKVGDDLIGLFANDIPPNHHPEDQRLYTLPRLLELGFQTAGIMEMGDNNRMGLPSHIDNLQIYKHPDAKSGNCYAVVKQINERYDVSIVSEKGEIFMQLGGYRTAEFMTGMDAELIAPLKAVTN